MELHLTKNLHKCSFFTLYIVLFSTSFTIIIGVATYFAYYKYMNYYKKTTSRYKQKIQAIQCNQVYFSSSNVSTNTIVIVKD